MALVTQFCNAAFAFWLSSWGSTDRIPANKAGAKSRLKPFGNHRWPNIDVMRLKMPTAAMFALRVDSPRIDTNNAMQYCYRSNRANPVLRAAVWD